MLASNSNESDDIQRMKRNSSFAQNPNKDICLASAKRAKCGIRSTLCWKVGDISGPT